ncbi:hypothetical protein [Aquibium oceanicum]|uniref:Tetratricopeptide repeat protein n=1 Tax=Aquibium oceanicum TaxID=1670800 RepID=A0A1L3SLC9_9HYPH|nr:hypothetical protein BSQ44_01570 [Aquibium oceanicum]
MSPFDPLLFKMLGTRALAHARLGHFDEAAEWAVKAAARLNAYANILAIAAHCLALAGRQREASAYTLTIHAMLPDYRTTDFLDAFRFTKEVEVMFRSLSGQIGMA